MARFLPRIKHVLATGYGTPLITKALAEGGGGSARMVGASVRMAEARRGG
jgi:hypothetical protein